MVEKDILDNISKIKLQIIINKELYDNKYLEYDVYRLVEERLLSKLKRIEDKSEIMV